MTFKEAKELLGTAGITCIAVKEGMPPLVSCVRGVGGIIGWIEEEEDLKGAQVCDTIVGRAAAMLYALAGVSFVYGRTMSRAAADELQKAGIGFEAAEWTDGIVNRQGTGMCPMEEAVLKIDDPRQALDALKEKISRLMGR